MNETSFLQRIPILCIHLGGSAHSFSLTRRKPERDAIGGLDREPLLLDVVYTSLVSTIPLVVRPSFSSRSFTMIRCTLTQMPITRNRLPTDSQMLPNQSQKFWGGGNGKHGGVSNEF